MRAPSYCCWTSRPLACPTTSDSVVGTLLRRLVDEGITCVLIEHDMDFVTEIAYRLVVLADGRVVEDGAPALVRESPAVREVYLGEVGV